MISTGALNTKKTQSTHIPCIYYPTSIISRTNKSAEEKKKNGSLFKCPAVSLSHFIYSFFILVFLIFKLT